MHHNSARPYAALGAIAAFTLLGCEPAPPLQSPARLETADDLFSDRQVWDIQIQLSDRARSRLRDEPRQYVRGDVTINGSSVRDIGIRLKGTFSFRSVDDKAAFKLKFNWANKRSRFVGLEGLTLNNLVQDRSLVHEWLGYRVFRAAGVPAPRSGYARVFVNDELYGLYAAIESADDVFLANNFADPSGNLYEEQRFSDLRLDDLWQFEQDEGKDDSRRDLAALIRAVEASGAGVLDDGMIEAHSFLAFVAVESLIGNWDGYVKSHNYRLYHEPASARWSFVPWGIDQTFDRPLGAFDGRGVLTTMCFESPACVGRYARAGLEVIEAVDGLELVDEVDRVASFVEPFAVEDPLKPYVMAKYRRHQKHAAAMIEHQATTLHAQFTCIVDGGDIATCRQPARDCVDDQCECERIVVGDARFALCPHAVAQARARSRCRQLGGDLAQLDDRLQNAVVFEASQRLLPSSWYIGLDDRAESGVYTWQNGAAPSELLWAPGEPDDFGGESCVAIDRFGDGTWADERCSLLLPFVCRIGTEHDD